ncbi:imidazoleglycerol-phosphate dehydratase HisB [Desulfatiglans anilini]|uniref:imidazoleglycerol-phosphate dehydratase HisB n=1 Tax=Desulfatiglans anilini TaxID=90728 RepID=UPI00041C1F01|nr:imidazoleglycerol-phosphate dehydratase HisB [Desulfatiglans anilini]
MGRTAEVYRKTKETDITLKLDLDGHGQSRIATPVPFMDHMLTLFAAHGFMDLQLTADGDTQIDDHHTVEDMGICLGLAVRQALQDKLGIRRYGAASVPMDETLVRVVLDISGRPFLAYRVAFPDAFSGRFDFGLLEEFFRAVVLHAGITLHIDLLAGKNAHHIAEAVFKAFGQAMDRATIIDPRREGAVPSTKGAI